MTGLYDPDTGVRTPCTVLQLDRVQVVAHRTKQRHGYWAVQLGAGEKVSSNVSRPLLGHFAASKVAPKRFVYEFRVRDERGLLPLGSVVTPAHFKEGQFVDAQSKSHGKGFAGGMKKHGWSGQPASHGQSLMHRGMGSSGGSQGSGSRVIPGKEMAGRMGNENRTIQNLRVLKIDEATSVVVVAGAVAGPKGCAVRIWDAKKKAWPDMPMASAGVVMSEAVMGKQASAQAVAA